MVVRIAPLTIYTIMPSGQRCPNAPSIRPAGNTAQDEMSHAGLKGVLRRSPSVCGSARIVISMLQGRDLRVAMGPVEPGSIGHAAVERKEQ